jgi:hypothetical protein
MTLDQARERAEKIFKQEERERDGKAALIEYEAHAIAVRENMARLRSLRLTKEKDEAKA